MGGGVGWSPRGVKSQCGVGGGGGLLEESNPNVAWGWGPNPLREPMPVAVCTLYCTVYSSERIRRTVQLIKGLLVIEFSVTFATNGILWGTCHHDSHCQSSIGSFTATTI